MKVKLAVTVSAITLMLVSVSTAMASKSVLNFDNELNAGFWSPLTDQVRGGKSTAFMRILGDGTAEISGELTLIDNAGFASYRVTQISGADWNFSGSSEISIEAAGDGRVYKILLKDQAALTAAFDYSWECELATDATGVLQKTRLPFSCFVPTYRGRFLPIVAPLDLEKIGQIGIQINDKVAGPYLFILKELSVD